MAGPRGGRVRVSDGQPRPGGLGGQGPHSRLGNRLPGLSLCVCRRGWAANKPCPRHLGAELPLWGHGAGPTPGSELSPPTRLTLSDPSEEPHPHAAGLGQPEGRGNRVGQPGGVPSTEGLEPSGRGPQPASHLPKPQPCWPHLRTGTEKGDCQRSPVAAPPQQPAGGPGRGRGQGRAAASCPRRHRPRSSPKRKPAQDGARSWMLTETPLRERARGTAGDPGRPPARRATARPLGARSPGAVEGVGAARPAGPPELRLGGGDHAGTPSPPRMRQTARRQARPTDLKRPVPGARPRDVSLSERLLLSSRGGRGPGGGGDGLAPHLRDRGAAWRWTQPPTPAWCSFPPMARLRQLIPTRTTLHLCGSLVGTSPASAPGATWLLLSAWGVWCWGHLRADGWLGCRVAWPSPVVEGLEADGGRCKEHGLIKARGVTQAQGKNAGQAQAHHLWERWAVTGPGPCWPIGAPSRGCWGALSKGQRGRPLPAEACPGDMWDRLLDEPAPLCRQVDSPPPV